MRARAFLVVLALSIASQSGCTPSGPELAFEEVPIRDQTAVDVLFVIDNSTSMAEEQAALAESARTLFETLITPTGGDDGVVPPATDLRVGVVSTDMGTGGIPVQTCADPVDGDGGALQSVGHLAGCAEAYEAPDCDPDGRCPWLSSSPDHPDDGSDGTPAIWEDFACIASLGTSGCGVRQPLEASYQALVEQTRPGGENEGFLRDDSLLAIVYVTTDDDCSIDDPGFFDPGRDDLGPMDLRCSAHTELLHPLERYRDAFVELRGGDDRRVVLTAIAGVPVDSYSWSSCEPDEFDLRCLTCIELPPPSEHPASCDTAMGKAYPPLRLMDLLCSLERPSHMESICRRDLTPALEVAARAIQSRVGVGCVELAPEVVPATDCRLVEVLDDGSEREVPRAEWLVDRDVEACPGGQLRIAGEPVGQDGFVFECRSAAAVADGGRGP